MKKAILAIIAACVGCCALLFLLPGMAGLTVLTATGLRLDTVLCAAPLAILAALAVYVLVKHVRKPKACATDKSCGC